MTICCNSAGGTMELTVNGTVYSVRGSASIMPTNLERSAESNLDGSVFVTSKPVPYMVEFALSDRCLLDLDELMNQTCVDATITLEQVGRTYIITEGTVIGRPAIDPETGEITGVSMAAANITTINFDI